MNNKFMKKGIKKAFDTMSQNIGGPFGAVIVKNNKIISVASNSVLKTNDPTAHAEINAIRKAGKKLKTYDLKGCELYATGYPCPMCLSAIIWSNISKVYFGCNPKDAENIGFRDDFIYEYIVSLRNNNENKKLLSLIELDRNDCLELFKEYSKQQKIIY